MNPNPEQQDQEVDKQQPMANMPPLESAEYKIRTALRKLATKKKHANILDLENDVKVLQGMYMTRIQRKGNIIKALRNGEKAPMDMGVLDSEWREKYEMFKTKLDKAFTVVGRSEYAELIEAMDTYREEKNDFLAKQDEEIKDLKAEKKGKKRDEAEAAEIRESLDKAA